MIPDVSGTQNITLTLPSSSGTLMLSVNTAPGELLSLDLGNNSTLGTLRFAYPGSKYLTISPAGSLGSNVTYTIPDVSSSASFVLTAGAQTIGGSKTFSSALAVTAASNQLVLGTSPNTLTLTASPTAARPITFPDVSGTVITTGNLASLSNVLTYNTNTTQNSADIASGYYLFDVSYSNTVVPQNALGARISVTATGNAKDATALTLSANSSAGTPGTSRALNITNGLLAMQGPSNREVTFTVPAGLAETTSYTWPANDGGAGKFLTIDDNGNMSWATIGSVSDSFPTLPLDDVLNVMFDHSAKLTHTLLVGHELSAAEIATIEAGDGAMYNVGVGYNALHQITTADYNTGLGHNTMSDLTTGSANVIVGADAAVGLVSGSRNVVIGYHAGPNSGASAMSEKLYIDNKQNDTPLIYGDFADGSEAVTINGALTLTGNATFNTSAKLKSSNGSGGITLQAGAMGGTGYTYTMPTGAPSSTQALKVSSVSGSDVTLEWGSISNVDLSSPGPIGGTTPSTATFTSVAISNATNQLSFGTTNTTTINAAAPSASRTYTIPDAGANASFVMSAGNQTIAGTKTFSSAPVLSSVTASRPLKVDGSNNVTSGTIDLTSSNDVTGTLPVANGGTGLASYTTGQIVYASTTNTLAGLNAGSTGQVLSVNGSGVPAWTTLSNTLPGGTATNSTLRYNGTGWVENTSVLASSDGAITLTKATNQLVLGTGNTSTISTAVQSGARTYTIPNAGADADFVMSAGSQTVAGDKTFSGSTTVSGSLTASGAVTLGDNGDNFEINSNAFDVSTAGALSGVTTLSMSGALTNTKTSDQIVLGTTIPQRSTLRHQVLRARTRSQTQAQTHRL
jgi:hypothetical protein